MGILGKIKRTQARRHASTKKSFAFSFRAFAPSRLRACEAFTLVEAIVAIIIIMVCFGLSTMIYVNIIRSDARLERSKAFMETKRYAVQTNINKRYFDEETTIDSLHIKRTIETYRNDPELKILNIETFNGKGKKISSHKQIVISK